MIVVHNSSEERNMMSHRVPFSHRCCLINILYISSDLSATISRKHGYGDGLDILLGRPSWKEMEEGLNKDTTILVEYLRNWRIRLA